MPTTTTTQRVPPSPPQVVRASAADTTPMVVQLIPMVVMKLQETLNMTNGGGLEAAERQSEIQVWAAHRPRGSLWDVWVTGSGTA